MVEEKKILDLHPYDLYDTSMPSSIDMYGDGEADMTSEEYNAMVTDLVADICTLKRRWAGGAARYCDDDELLRFRLGEIKASI